MGSRGRRMRSVGVRVAVEVVVFILKKEISIKRKPKRNGKDNVQYNNKFKQKKNQAADANYHANE